MIKLELIEDRCPKDKTKVISNAGCSECKYCENRIIEDCQSKKYIIKIDCIYTKNMTGFIQKGETNNA
jgi:hypothetical protein